MNWEDAKYLFKPSEGTQAPVLNQAIGLAKNDQQSIEEQIIPSNLYSDISSVLNSSSEELKKRTGFMDFGNWKWKENNEIVGIGDATIIYDKELGDEISKLGSSSNFNNAAKQEPIRIKVKAFLESIMIKSIKAQITSEQNIDMPIWFSYQELCTKFIDAAIAQESTGNNRIAEFVSTLRLRMRSFLNDKRMAIPLMLKDYNVNNKEVLAQFIAFVLGDFNRFYKQEENKSFIKNYNDTTISQNTDKTNQLTIVDVSQLPFEVLETVTALLGRLIIEFVSHFLPAQRGNFPIVIVLEEAQNYIAEKTESVAKTVFERIAREGRKYGISLVVCSQRPSELSKTVLSQCNSFIIHRLQNPEDQKYIKGLVSSANADILDQLSIIPQQHAIITGDCVRTPIQVRIDDVSPTPNSHNPRYIKNWLTDLKIPYDETCNTWLGKSKVEK
jgi:hypothetical protein